MAQKGSEATMNDVRGKISTLWIVVMLNIIYADIIGFLDAEFLRELMSGYADGTRITQTLMLAAAVTGEIPILMVLLSRVLKPTANRWANFVAAPLTAAFVIGGGMASPHYLLLASIELVCMAFILRYAWQCRPETAPTASPELSRAK
jgi:uncharacterized protein DUF6326